MKQKIRPAKDKDISQPGIERKMERKPAEDTDKKAETPRLLGRTALITGGDSGIGRAVAIAFAKEGADIAISYLSEDKDAEDTKREVEAYGRRCILISGDVGHETVAKKVIQKTMKELGKIDILVNNAGEQHPQTSILDISQTQLEKTFRTNIFSMFYLVKAVLPYLKSGSSIINTSSVTAYRGSDKLVDYAATKGAIVSFTRSLSSQLLEKGIRVNAVAPGAVWTPLIPSTFSKEEIKGFGKNNPMGRAGEPTEIAPAYVFLASDEAAFISGQVIHPNGGEIING